MPGSRAAILIVTPYHREPPAVLERCIASVAAQTVAADHLLVSDGHPQDWIDRLPVRHIRLDQAHGDYGNTPRAIGLMLGVAEGYAGIGLLDADNWIDPDHTDACLTAAAHDPACDYVIAQRRFVRPDGSEMPLGEAPGIDHVDTSCFFFREGSYPLLPYWGTMPREVSPICDRIFKGVLETHGMRAAATDRVTVNFQVNIAGFYRRIGEAPPPGARDGSDIRAMQLWADGLDDAALAQASRRAGVRLMRSIDRPDGPAA